MLVQVLLVLKGCRAAVSNNESLESSLDVTSEMTRPSDESYSVNSAAHKTLSLTGLNSHSSGVQGGLFGKVEL